MACSVRYQIICLAFSMLFTLGSCKKSTVDADLDYMNNLVTQLENKSKTEGLKFDDYMVLQNDLLQMQHESEILTERSKFTPEQKKRAEEITNRLGTLILKNKNIQL